MEQGKLKRSQRIELEFLESVRNRCPANPHVLRAVGELYTRAGRHEDGLHIDLELAKLCPRDSDVWYNLGCSYALVGRPDDSFSALFRAVDLGYTDYDWLIHDADLMALHKDPRFKSLIAKMRSWSKS